MEQTINKMKERDINVLVCLSASPSNQKVIRSAARFAGTNNWRFTALFIDGNRQAEQDPFLQNNMDLARTLGAVVEIIEGRDVLGTIMDYAIEAGVTDIFIGYSGPERWGIPRHLPVYRLVKSLPDVDVHIIPDAGVNLQPSRLVSKADSRLNVKDFLKMTSIMTVATFISMLFDRSRFSNGNIITIYILAVLITSVMTAERIYGIIAAVLYILLFNFLFIEPRFSFLVYDPYYLVTYLVSIIAAVITGNVSSRMKQSTQQARSNAYQAQILLNTSELLQKADSSEQIMRITTSQLQELLGRKVVFYTADEINAMDLPEIEALPHEPEPDLIRWTFTHNRRSGWGTNNYPDAAYQYLCVRLDNTRYGVIGVAGDKGNLDSFEESILLSLIGECAMSLEGEKTRREREEALVVAENERCRSKLLRSISHDLRTPLTSISGNAANLISHEGDIPADQKKRIYTDIYEDSIWLIDLVENLLAITRFEQNVKLHLTGEIVADVITDAVNHARRHKADHHIILETDDECLVAQMDVPLILQVMNNLISNAIKHTPEKTTILVRDWREDDCVLISVSDNGPGIPDDEKEQIFDLFYTGNKKGADSSRSLGLGLNLCRSIIEAHGGSIHVEDNNPAGSNFIFSLKLWKEQNNEGLSDTGS